jgi:hypothetical protein
MSHLTGRHAWALRVWEAHVGYWPATRQRPHLTGFITAAIIITVFIIDLLIIDLLTITVFVIAIAAKRRMTDAR